MPTDRPTDRGSLAIEAVQVRKTYDRGKVAALDGVDLDVALGEYVAVTGPSGCGKSTLLHVLAALDNPDSGELWVAGEDVNRLSNANLFRREKVGIVFQMHNLLPHLDATTNVAVAMIGTRATRSEQRERAQELLSTVGLADVGHRRPPELSGGERQRVALARALANRPSVLLADEPTGSLDSASKEMVLGVVERLRSEEHVTVVIVTHDDQVAATADRVVHLLDGRVVDEVA